MLGSTDKEISWKSQTPSAPQKILPPHLMGATRVIGDRTPALTSMK
jgi:hypothetical protein